MLEYKIVRTMPSFDILEKTVNENIKSSWIPIGSFVIEYRDHKPHIFCQTMKRESGDV